MLYRVGARRWIARIMISWGLVSAAMSLAIGPSQLLSAAIPARRRRGRLLSRHRVLSLDLVSVRVPHAHHRVVHGGDSGVVGDRRSVVGPAARAWTASAVLPAGSGSSSSKGFRWWSLGSSVLWLLPDRPEDATWLTDDDRRIVQRASGDASGSRRRCGACSAALAGRAGVDAGRRAVRLSRRLVRRSDSSCRRSCRRGQLTERADRLSDQRLLRLRDAWR